MLLSLTLIALVASLALALVNNVTKGPIEKVNQEKVANAIKKVLPEGIEYTIQSDKVSVQTDKGPAEVMRYTAVDAEGNTVGKAIESFDNNGFGGKLTAMVGFDAEGNISEILYTYITAELKEVSMKYYLTWQDGDLTQAVIEYLSTERPSTTLTFLYDKYPSAYTSMPIGTSLIDPTALALHASKHNLIENGDNLVYYHGRLISIVSADSKTQTFFTYSDGTGKR